MHVWLTRRSIGLHKINATGTYCSIRGDKYNLGYTWVASVSSKLTERRATSSPGSSFTSLNSERNTTLSAPALLTSFWWPGNGPLATRPGVWVTWIHTLHILCHRPSHSPRVTALKLSDQSPPQWEKDPHQFHLFTYYKMGESECGDNKELGKNVVNELQEMGR